MLHVKLTNDSSIRRILIVKWNTLGDVALSTAQFEDIYRAFPDAAIDLHTLPEWAPLFADDPRFEDILAIDVLPNAVGRGGIRQWLKRVRHGRYDLIVDLQSNDRSRLLMTLLWLTGAAPRYRMGKIWQFPYTLAPRPDDRIQHPFELQQRTLQSGQIPTPTPRPVLYPGPERLESVRNLMATNHLEEGKFAVLMPGSHAAGALKRWGSERYARLALLLKQRGVEHVVLVGSKDDLEECQAIEGYCEGGWLHNLCGQTELGDLAPLCGQARLIVANDTAIAHLASCSDRPLVVICGPTDPRKVKPVGDNVVALQAEGLECLNCSCAPLCEHHTCMVRITPEQVLAALPPGTISE